MKGRTGKKISARKLLPKPHGPQKIDRFKHGGKVDGKKSHARADRRARGGKLTAKARNALPSKDFALAGRKYPINNPSHARNALSRVSANGSPEQKATVRAAVHRKYPNIGKK